MNYRAQTEIIDKIYIAIENEDQVIFLTHPPAIIKLKNVTRSE